MRGSRGPQGCPKRVLLHFSLAQQRRLRRARPPRRNKPGRPRNEADPSPCYRYIPYSRRRDQTASPSYRSSPEPACDRGPPRPTPRARSARSGPKPPLIILRYISGRTGPRRTITAAGWNQQVGMSYAKSWNSLNPICPKAGKRDRVAMGQSIQNTTTVFTKHVSSIS